MDFNQIFKKGIWKRPLKSLKKEDALIRREKRMEMKLNYLLRHLSVYASQKLNRKSLPAKEKIEMKFNGMLVDKIIQQWEGEFIREAVKVVLNAEISKMRYFIHIEVSNETPGVFPKGDMTITMNYFIHKA